MPWLNVLVLIAAEICAMSLWFVSAAILPEITAEANLSATRAAALSAVVQVGFVAGAILMAVHGTPDRLDPRRVFAASAIAAALCNFALLVTEPGGDVQIVLRGLTGFFLAGVYPVGMKIAIGWSQTQRGLLVGLLVGSLTLGTAAPHGLALLGGADWRTTVVAAGVLAVCAGLMVLLTRLGPFHAVAPRFDPGALRLAWSHRPIRLAYAGYLCHMWEPYAFWAWIAVALTLSFEAAQHADAAHAARMTTFAAVALGRLLCVPAGAVADRWGKSRVAGLAMALSALAAFATAFSFGGPPALTILCVILWGAFVIPDSAQFSAMVADAATPERAGSLLALQTALGFMLTAFTVQATPMVAAAIGWPETLMLLGLGPVLGVEAMRRHVRLKRAV